MWLPINKRGIYIVLLLFGQLLQCSGFLEAIGVGIASWTICKIRECCNEQTIPANFNSNKFIYPPKH